jgi:hypothetical protein
VEAYFLERVFKVYNPDGALVLDDGDAFQIIRDHELDGMNDSVTHVHGWGKGYPFRVRPEDFVNFSFSHAKPPNPRSFNPCRIPFLLHLVCKTGAILILPQSAIA